MSEHSLQPVIATLEKLFSKMNAEFFGGNLPMPVITVSPDDTKGAYGWRTGWRAWTDKPLKPIADMTPEEIEASKDEGYYEINLCAEHIARPFEETAGTLLHEMVHLYNIGEGVKDTSRGGFYHNKNFKEAAEAHGLTVEKTPKYGWSKTKLTDSAREFVNRNMKDMQFNLYRKSSGKGGKGKKKSASSRKYVCPDCGAIIRATKEVYVICGECEVPFELAE